MKAIATERFALVFLTCLGAFERYYIRHLGSSFVFVMQVGISRLAFDPEPSYPGWASVNRSSDLANLKILDNAGVA